MPQGQRPTRREPERTAVWRVRVFVSWRCVCCFVGACLVHLFLLARTGSNTGTRILSKELIHVGKEFSRHVRCVVRVRVCACVRVCVCDACALPCACCGGTAPSLKAGRAVLILEGKDVDLTQRHRTAQAGCL